MAQRPKSVPVAVNGYLNANRAAIIEHTPVHTTVTSANPLYRFASWLHLAEVDDEGPNRFVDVALPCFAPLNKCRFSSTAERQGRSRLATG
jgi:hypothetical protein